MAEQAGTSGVKPTLGLTGVTMNAMAHRARSVPLDHLSAAGRRIGS
jgi:hypothetical protein